MPRNGPRSSRPPARALIDGAPRPDARLVARAAACATSDLYEAMDAQRRDDALMRRVMRPLAAGLRIAGPAVTARCAPRDNLMMHRALLLAQPGDVLVVEAEPPSGAQWGMLAAVYAEEKKLAGVIVDGCIRDVDDLRARNFPVWFTDVSPAHPDKRGPGCVNMPVRCGGVDVRPGDIICVDGDGVLVIRAQELAATIERAEQRQRREQDDIAGIKAGWSLFEIHDLARPLAASNVPEIDATWNDDE